jgi:hypothetical protein
MIHPGSAGFPYSQDPYMRAGMENQYENSGKKKIPRVFRSPRSGIPGYNIAGIYNRNPFQMAGLHPESFVLKDRARILV